MAQINFICSLIAILLAVVHQSNAVITDTVCTPGNATAGDTKCHALDTNSECPAGRTTCKCKADYFVSSGKPKCGQKITTLACTTGVTGTTECKKIDANSECKTGGKCTCNEGYTGPDSCTKDITTVVCTSGTAGTTKCKQFDANSECKTGGNCACKEGYKGTYSCTEDITGNTCTPNDNTNGNTKCQAFDPNAECPGSGSPSNCACKSDYFLGTDKTKCLHKITTVACTVGATGTTTCQKIDANSECKTGGTKCTCKAGYKGTDSCTKVLGETCANDGECTGSESNSACSTQKCKCKDNFIEESAICKKALGQVCTKKDDCVSNAECDNKECKCSAGFAKTNGLCAAESSATSAWMATSLLVTSMLIFLPRFILW